MHEYAHRWSDIMSAPMRYAYDLCRLYAQVDRPVVLVGPVGAGKSTLAREIHRMSQVAGPLVTVSSGELGENLYSDTLFGHVEGAYTGASATRDGVIRQASDGVLLLDDLVLMPPVAQESILRVMEEGRYRRLGSRAEMHATCKFIFATTVSPKELVEAGKLLVDLESRLGEFQIRVPSLVERRDDVMAIADRCGRAMLEEHGTRARLRFSEKAVDLLQRYCWPANVRELRAVIERAVVHAGVMEGEVVIRAPHLPERIRTYESDSEERAELSVDLVEWLVRKTGGNQTEAARQLGVHRNTIPRYLLESDAER